MKKYFQIHKKLFYRFLCIAIFYALIVSSTGFVFQAITEAALSDNFKNFILTASFSIIFLLLDTYFDYAPRFLKAKLVNAIMYSLRGDLINYYSKKNMHELMLENPSERTNRLVNQLETIENSYLKPLTSSFISTFIFIFSLIGAFYLQGTLTIIMLTLCFLPFLSPIINKKILSNKKQKTLEMKKEYLTSFEDFSKNILTIRLTNSIKKLNNILNSKSVSTQRYTNDFDNAQAKTYAVSYGLSNIVYSGTWIIGGIFVFYNQLEIPALIAITTLMGTVAGPIQTLNGLIIDISSSKDITNDFIKEINTEPVEIDYSTYDFKNDSIEEISLSNISYFYDDKVIFNKENYTFNKTEKYAIRGDSGVGKSTLLMMILGIIPPKSGEIIINSLNQQNIISPTLYKKISFVPQKTELFEGTITQNITMFEKDDQVDEKKILSIIQKVGLKKWLENNKNGLNTMLSSKKPLSGGEEKRLDIARALYQEADVILMDEPTSGLDITNENLIAEIIKMINDKIVIIVTHSNNFTFLNSFDTVLKLDQGSLTKETISSP